MQQSYSVQQVFLRLRGGQLVLEFVLVAPGGVMEHDKVSFPTRSELEATKRGAVYLAAKGDMNSADNVRVHVERRGELKNEASLGRLFKETFEDEIGD